MRTYSHALLTAALDVGCKAAGLQPNTRTFLIGAVLPDIPFGLLSLASWLYLGWFSPWFGPADRFAMRGGLFRLIDYLYFHDPFWLFAHNLFHAPLLLLVFWGIGRWAERRTLSWGRALVWLAYGCAFHSIVDILTHHTDGPLLFFPLNWSYRFASPISYWDPAHYGRIFTRFELGLDLLIGVWLLGRWLWGRWRGGERSGQLG